MATVYILHSRTLDKYYVGYTKGDIINRINRHLSNHKGFTSKAKDWILVYTEEYEFSDDAYKRERQIKSWKCKKMIERLVKGS